MTQLKRHRVNVDVTCGGVKSRIRVEVGALSETDAMNRFWAHHVQEALSSYSEDDRAKITSVELLSAGEIK